MVKVSSEAKKLHDVVFRGKPSSREQRQAVQLVIDMVNDESMTRSAANLWLAELGSSEKMGGLLNALEKLREGSVIH